MSNPDMGGTIIYSAGAYSHAAVRALRGLPQRGGYRGPCSR